MADQILSDQESPTVHEVDIPDLLPLLPVRDIVVFPHMVIPLFVGREMSIRAIEHALSTNRLLFLAAQRSRELEAPKPDDIHTVGTCVTIMRMLKLPDERIKILVQGLVKAEIVEYVQDGPFYQVKIVKLIDPSMPGSHAIETEAAMRTVKEQLEQIASLGKGITPDMIAVIESIEEPGRLADMATANLGLKVDGTQEILEILDPILRLKRVSELLGKEIKLLSMQQKIHAEAKGEIDKTQREYFLREQLKAIQKELGELDERAEEIHEFKQRINAAAMPGHVLKETEKQLKRLEKMHPDTAEAATVRTYLEWMVDIPWNTSTKDRLDIKTATTVLDEDHYDLEKVKERILEYLAVRRLKAKMKGPILCFVGPRGWGKPLLANPSHAYLDANSSEFPWAVSAMKPKSAAIDVPTLARSRVGSFKASNRPNQITQCLCLMKLTRLAQISVGIPQRHSWKCSTLSRTIRLATIMSVFSLTFQTLCSSRLPISLTLSYLRCAIAWKLSKFPGIPKKKKWV